MEYVQERVTTLHDFTDPRPSGPLERTAVVVPMAQREHATLAAERVFETLAEMDLARVVVPLRAEADRAGAIADWLVSYGDDTIAPLWCDGPRVADRLATAGLSGPRGKGRDLWLGLGVAAAGPDVEYVITHDADARSYDGRRVRRLLFPLARDYAFSKGYYARVEDGHLYGRLFRLFYRPLMWALPAAPFVSYLDAFRYALAGEMGFTAAFAHQVRAQPGWGLEVGVLGEAFAHAGFTGTAQVDLGVHEHDHRAVAGTGGLGDMSTEVGTALFRALADHDVMIEFSSLRSSYADAVDRLIEQYAADAAFNDLAYDGAAERDQADTYASAIDPPGPDRRLPAWSDADLTPGTIEEAARADLREVR